MKKISYLDLQKKYAGKLVALDKKQKQIVAVAEKFSQLFKKLDSKGLNPKNQVFIGPIQKAGSINVYHFSLRAKTYR